MKKKLNKKSIAILVIAIVIVILIIVLAILEGKNRGKNTAELEQQIQQSSLDTKISKLAQMTEMERIKTYLSEFIGKIEDKKYDEAYEALYSEFKDRYFRSQLDFENYCKEYFPVMFDVQNQNMERVNNIYVLETTIRDLVNSSSKINLYFVIRENGLNDYEISFSVDSAIKAK